MERCENCVLLEIVGNQDDEFWNRCTLSNGANLNIREERECMDFQPGP